jgi:hypothetical protein
MRVLDKITMMHLKHTKFHVGTVQKQITPNGDYR